MSDLPNGRSGNASSIDVFVSYMRRDVRLSDIIVSGLSETMLSPRSTVSTYRDHVKYISPFKVWRDKENIVPGTLWPDAIVKGVKLCKVMIVLIPTEHSVRVALECGMAMGLGKAIVPLTHDSNLLSEYGLDQIQSLSLPVIEDDGGVIFDMTRLKKVLLDVTEHTIWDFIEYTVPPDIDTFRTDNDAFRISHT